MRVPGPQGLVSKGPQGLVSKGPQGMIDAADASGAADFGVTHSEGIRVSATEYMLKAHCNFP